MADLRTCLHECKPPCILESWVWGSKDIKVQFLPTRMQECAILGSSIFLALQPAIESPTRSSSEYQGPYLVVSFHDCRE